MSKSHDYTNRLIHSTSPYLQQHAHNPVDWYEWGDEAFNKADAEDKPIFLSIGYSTCHWCHVMAHESFEDLEVAKLLNDNFISIKVDREERPDIDQLYMKAATSLIGRGGWPLTIIMSPDKRPFFAGTYFPKASVGGRIGMLELLPRITKAWNTQREEIKSASDQVMHAIQQTEVSGSGETLDESTLQQATANFKHNYDSQYGGFGSAPKFPSPHNLIFLMREGFRTGDEQVVNMALHSLRQMRLGGIFDQVGYGFHRYSTDARWHVPHFEKMLYDQAGLMLAYTEAWEISGEPLFRQTVEEIFLYMEDKLRSPFGAYYSAEDADSDGEEGKFYVWSLESLQNLLSAAELEQVTAAFMLEPQGNFQDEVTRRSSGANIFHLASEKDYSRMILSGDWESIRKKLYRSREQKTHPGLDNKILADWNGLVLTAFSRAAEATGDRRYADAAEKLADYLIGEMMTESGVLIHLPRDGNPEIYGFLDDYSFVIQGLRHYYQISFDPHYLAVAIQLQEFQLKTFWDFEQGGFFFTGDANEKLFIRQKEIYDGAMPSGNSTAALNLYYLGRLAEKPEWEAYAAEIGSVFSEQIKRVPQGFSALLQSVQVQTAGSREIVISGSRLDLKAANSVLRKFYDPFKLTLYRPNQGSADIESIASFLAYQKAIDQALTIYICENYTCQQPITDLNSLEETLSQLYRN